MTVLDERRKKTLLLKFRQMDEMLSEVDRLADGRRPSSLFAGEFDLLPLHEREELHGYTARLRQIMHRILSEKDVCISAPPAPIDRTIHNLLMFMDMAVEELRPKYLRGYGELTEEAAAELDAVATEIQQLLKQMDSVTIKKDLKS